MFLRSAEFRKAAAVQSSPQVLRGAPMRTLGLTARRLRRGASIALTGIPASSATLRRLDGLSCDKCDAVLLPRTGNLITLLSMACSAGRGTMPLPAGSTVGIGPGAWTTRRAVFAEVLLVREGGADWHGGRVVLFVDIDIFSQLCARLSITPRAFFPLSLRPPPSRTR